MRRRTRIVATLGPATDPPEVLHAVLEAGLDVARINFAHGSPDDHLRRIDQLREAASHLGRPVAVLGDLPGPKLRVLLQAERQCRSGEEIGFSKSEKPDRPEDVTITEPEAFRDVRPGERILLDDGRLQLEAVRAEPNRVVARVLVGGTLRPNKGVNLPDSPLPIPALTPRDRAALEVAARAGVDWLALSFVREPRAADEVRAEARRLGLDAPVIAKVERPEAVDHAAEIVDAFDGVMVARGDLGVEVPLERVPTVQKRLIALARAAGKPVVTATDMLDSMRENPRPTRAEAGDVANAVFDGTDAVMLSGETAVGKYPVEAVACMARIALEAEAHLRDFGPVGAVTELHFAAGTLDDHITSTVCALAREVAADAIIAPTLSGRTARMVARHRPIAAIVAPAPTEAVLRRMAIVWGLQPVLMPTTAPGADRIEAAVEAAFAAKAVEAGQRVIVVAGHPVEGGERLPTIRLLKVGADGRSAEP